MMPDATRLVRFLASLSPEGAPQLIIELEDGRRLKLNVDYGQLEDLADLLDEILDSSGAPGEPDAAKPPLSSRAK
jgi:hypothetical protein